MSLDKGWSRKKIDQFPWLSFFHPLSPYSFMFNLSFRCFFIDSHPTHICRLFYRHVNGFVLHLSLTHPSCHSFFLRTAQCSSSNINHRCVSTKIEFESFHLFPVSSLFSRCQILDRINLCALLFVIVGYQVCFFRYILGRANKGVSYKRGQENG